MQLTNAEKKVIEGIKALEEYAYSVGVSETKYEILKDLKKLVKCTETDNGFIVFSEEGCFYKVEDVQRIIARLSNE